MTRTRTPRRRLRVARFVILSLGAVVTGIGLFFFHKFQVYREAGSIRDRAAAAARERKWPVSVSLYRNYLRLQPEDTAAMEEFADSLEELIRFDAPGKVPELISTYERLRHFNSLSPENRRKLARYNLAAGRTAAAWESIELLLNSPETRPDDAGVLELAAACQEQVGQAKEATGFYEKAVRTGKAEPETYFRLALISRKTATDADPDAKPVAVLNDLIRARPAELKGRLLLAQYYLQHSKNPRAADLARVEIEVAYSTAPGSENLDVIQTLASMYTVKGDFAQAQKVLSEAMAKYPEELRLQVSLADVQLQRSDAPAAKKILLALAARELPLSLLTLEVADRLLDLNETAAVAAIAKKFAKNEAGYAADYLTGRIALAEGDWRAAKPLLQNAVAAGLVKFPRHHAVALVGLADCYALANSEALRAKTLAEAVRVDPRSVRARLGQADGLARAGKTAEALALYAQMAPQVKEARAALLDLRVKEVLSRPEAERDWRVLDEYYGPKPWPPQVEVVRATVLIRQGKLADGIALLEKTVAEAVHLTGPRVALAYARAGQSPEAGLRVLGAAEKAIGDRVEFRLARLDLMLRTGAVDLRAVAALGEQTGPFTPAERYQLFAGLGETFARLNRPAEAIAFYRQAAAANPFDVAPRVNLFHLALRTEDAPLQEQMLNEIEALDGPASPVRDVCAITRDLKSIKPGDTGRVEELRERLKTVGDKRPNWSPVEVLVADLDLISGRADAALAHYRRAMELGDESDPVVSNVVRLLRDRGGDLEALGLLDGLSRRRALSEELTRQLVVLRSAYGQDSSRSLAWARAPEQVNSKQPRDHLTRAGVLEANGARGEARKAVEAARSLDENVPETWVALVRLVVAEGKPTEAKAEAEAAAKALKPVPGRPESAVALALALGACQEIVGDLGRAEKYARDALALAPTDVAANRQLNRLLYRTGRGPEADKLFEALAENAAAPAEARRYARRVLAYAKVMHSGAPAELAAALALIDRNREEGGDLDEDKRAAALVLSTDPFRQVEAIDRLTEIGKRTPLTAEENYYLGRMYSQQGQPDLAEKALRESTRAVALAQPEHLAYLAKVQCERSNAPAAEATVAALKANFAGTWEAVTEEARVLVLNGRKPEAAKRVLESTFAGDAESLLKRVAPFLEEIDLKADAETIYRAAAKAGTPLAHAPLGGFLLRNGRAADAVALAYAHEATAPVGVTAKLLAGGARVLPVELAPEADRAKWKATVQGIDEWVARKLAGNASDPDVLFAKAELDDLFGRYADEIATYEKLLALAPDNDIFLNNFAMILALHNRDGGDRPLGMVNAVIARKGSRATLLDTRAVVHLAGERYAEAIEDSTVARRLEPKKPVYAFHLALAEERKAGEKGSKAERDAAVLAAVRGGLTKAKLHAKEWPDFDRLTAK